MKSFIAAAVGSAIAATAVSTSSAGISGSGAELLVVGPVESIDLVQRSATVLGQRIFTRQPDQLSVGDTVAVFGKAAANGAIVAMTIEPRGLYVPGATPIFLSGVVQKAEPTIGRVVLNGVRVDLTPAMSHGTLAPTLGTKLSVAGIQPVSHGTVLVNGISGSGAGTSGISGSGAGTSGISGSGAGTSGISGSGARTSGISGSGAGTSGISGSGARTNGISGSGAGTSGISGSGAGTSGISGSGARTLGISGSGAGTSGISGSGARTSGISGSGARTNGISGSGVGTSGISGSGAGTS